METIVNVTEIKCWLKVILKHENIANFSLKVLGSEKSDGHVGDIVFLSLIPISDPKQQSYNLVLKCGKRSPALREQVPVKLSFLNEMYIYNVVFPKFNQFQVERGVEPFDSVAKCYGTLENENAEVILLENMKNIGYSMWNKKNPFTRRHIDLVCGEYAKFHAVSIAMNDQHPEEFEELRNGLNDAFERFGDQTNMVAFFENAIEEIHDILRGELDESILLKWKTLSDKIEFTLLDIIKGKHAVQVILHGDSWSNNFLFKHATGDETLPVKAAILDWQISHCASPILDLSYFIFAGSSKEDLKDLENILRYYYASLSENVKNLGSNLHAIYPFEEFLKDWKNCCKFGVIFGSSMYKICSTDKGEVMDVEESAEKGVDFVKSFEYDVKDKVSFKNRSKYVVKYVVENKLI